MTSASRPFGMLAEITYACPLHCPYCSNPLNLADYREELTTAEWQRVLAEARALGVLQLHLSGGEPLLRRDLVELVATARDLGLYTNLITSAVGLSTRRAEQLRAAGLDHVQISIQADEAGLSDRIAGTPSYERKVAAARLVKALGWPLTLNVVLHRHNIDRVDRVLALAEELGADRIELANTQYYGWAWRNRGGLLPSRAQLERAEAVVRAARQRLEGRMQVIYVIPDYYSRYPKPCMGGWGRQQLTVTPNGDVLPCPAAHILNLPRASVRERSLAWIWEESPLFQRFRGTEWMPEPCRSCERRTIDFGGCRCQAFLLTGDPARTDPVCYLSPDRWMVDEAIRESNERAEHDGPEALDPRTYPASRARALPLYRSAREARHPLRDRQERAPRAEACGLESPRSRP
ncbi:MAG: pyrroloquinoline quinone biosynthesis protein PqqE [Thermomicrobiaceae bacterium]|nr:pyrroloquinoline quinone biosynthesis protein PqqE [Thermomicrobiaceae bacterium]